MFYACLSYQKFNYSIKGEKFMLNSILNSSLPTFVSKFLKLSIFSLILGISFNVGAQEGCSFSRK